MGGCSAMNCTNNSQKGLKMVRFPKNKHKSKIWAKNCGRPNWEAGPQAQLCITHFDDSQFEPWCRNRKKLRRNAIPTVFKILNEPPSVEDSKRQEIKCLKPNTLTEMERKTDFLLYVGLVEKNKSFVCTEFSDKNLSNIDKGRPVIITKRSPLSISPIPVKKKSTDYTYSKNGKKSSDTIISQDKENASLNLLPDEDVYPLKEKLTYEKLFDNLHLIKKPNAWWTVTPVADVIICARFNEDYIIQKRVVIESNLVIRVFLNKWEINVTDLLDINCVDDISALLEKVERYEIS